MLPADHRLRTPSDIRTTVRGGVRISRRTMVMHAKISDFPPTRVGFVVSKQVGNAVVRNRVKRRLRHMAPSWISTTEPPIDVVVRALPAAASRPSELGLDFASAWSEAMKRLGEKQ